jgi:hypothetical protein
MAKRERITPAGAAGEGTPNLDLFASMAGKPNTRKRITPSASIDLTAAEPAAPKTPDEPMGFAKIDHKGNFIGAGVTTEELDASENNDGQVFSAGGPGSWNHHQVSGNYRHLMTMAEIADRLGHHAEDLKHVLGPKQHGLLMKDISLMSAHVTRAITEHTNGNSGLKTLDKGPKSVFETRTETDALGPRTVERGSRKSLVSSSSPGSDQSSVRTDAITKEARDRGYGDSLDQLIKETPGLESELKYQGSAGHLRRAASLATDIMGTIRNTHGQLDDKTRAQLASQGVPVPEPWSGRIENPEARGPKTVEELADRTADAYIKNETDGKETGLTVHLNQEIEPDHNAITSAFNRVRKSRESMENALTAQWQFHKSIIKQSYDRIFKPLLMNRVDEAKQKNIANMQQFRTQFPKGQSLTADQLSPSGLEYERPSLKDYQPGYVNYNQEKQLFPEKAHAREVGEALITSGNAMKKIDNIEKTIGLMNLSPEVHETVKGIIASARASHSEIAGHHQDAITAITAGEKNLPPELDLRDTLGGLARNSFEAVEARAKLADNNLARVEATEESRQTRFRAAKLAKNNVVGSLGRIKEALTSNGVSVPSKPTLIQPDLTGIPSLETYERASGFNRNAMDIRGRAVPNPETKPATMTETIRYAQQLQSEGDARAAAPAPTPAPSSSRSDIFNDGRGAVLSPVNITMGETPEMAVAGGPTPSPKRARKLERAAMNKLGRGNRRGRMGANPGIDIGRATMRPELDEFGIFRPGVASTVSGNASLSELAKQGDAEAGSTLGAEPGLEVTAKKATRRTRPKATPVVFEGPKTQINPAAGVNPYFNDRRKKK